MTQTHSVSLGCPGCPKRSVHLFSPPNARADQRSARTRLASGDISRALNNPPVVYKTGALAPAHMPHAFTGLACRAPVYIHTRSVHVSYTLIFAPKTTPTHSIPETSTKKHTISKNRIVHVSHLPLVHSQIKSHSAALLPILFILSKTPRLFVSPWAFFSWSFPGH
jgi:hypothetical protein